MDKFDFSFVSDIELVLMRKAILDFAAKEDKEFLDAIDEELRRREKLHQSEHCPHGYADWDDCPVCRH